MRMKGLSLLLAAAMLFMLSSSVYAVGGSQVKQADLLKQLGLFSGTDKGYLLEGSFTRAQGTVMLLRLAGESDDADRAKLKPSFKDVKAAHWAAASIAYAVSKGYVKGLSPAAFAPDRSMTGSEFLTLILRLLGYPNASPAKAADLSQKIGLLQPDAAKRLTTAKPFLRGDMVEAAAAALTAKQAGSTRTLIQELVEDKGAVAVDAAVASGLYQKPKKPSGSYVPAPGTDPMDAIEDAIRQKLDEQ
ncbi:S-layer homology domain-containing protein [Paenibacillus silvisoli]|uniref:S-layer homology domain-containing protein n=1 Tax=Paenibacillus silvisoli TaxID=3110539 RepID=UPI0028038762|nr:S-layer homology domain-containing protein [Paenibacillus silvisoli]